MLFTFNNKTETFVFILALVLRIKIGKSFLAGQPHTQHRDEVRGTKMLQLGTVNKTFVRCTQKRDGGILDTMA